MKSILVVFILVACQPAKVTTVLPTQSGPIAAPSPSLAPIEVDDDLGSVIPKPEPSPSAEVVPILTASVGGIVELPEWVKNPENNLVLFAYDDAEGNPSKFGFINPQNGEQVIVGLSRKFYHYYWKDSNHVMFLQNGDCDEPPEFITDLEISTGALKIYNSKDYSGPVQSCYPTFDSEKDIAKLNTDLSEPTIEVLDSSTGQHVRLTDPSDGVSDIRYEVSPDKKYVAVVQVDGEFQFPERAQPLFGNQISIYSFQDRKLLQTFDVGQIISTELLFAYNGDLVYKRENTPCVITLPALTKKCILNISEKFSNATIVLGESFPNSSRLSFSYFTHEPHHGGFCFYDLFSGDIDCPTDHFKSMEAQTVISYSLSPDQQYLLFIYDYKGCPPYWCDYVGNPQLAIIDIKDNELFELGSPDIHRSLDIFGTNQPWRPKP